MTYAATTLQTQQDELFRCASRREVLLKALFSATEAFLGGSPGGNGEEESTADTKERELLAFLDANDIKQNRRFDASTLPSRPRSARLAEQRAAKLSGSTIAIASTTAAAAAAATAQEQAQRLQQQPLQQQQRILRDGSLDKRSVEGSSTGSSDRADDREGGDGSQQTAAKAAEAVASTDGRTPSTTLPAVSSSSTTNANTDNAVPHSESATINVGLGSGLSKDHASPQTINGPKELSDVKVIAHGSMRHTPHAMTPPDSACRVPEVNGMDSQTNRGPHIPESPRPSQGQAQLSQPIQSSAGERERKDGAGLVGEAEVTNELPSQFMHGALDEGNSIMAITPLSDDAAARSQLITSPVAVTGMRNTIHKSVNGESATDPTFSRRPPIRIDTEAQPMPQPSLQATAPLKTPASVTMTDGVTSTKMTPVSAEAQSPPERRVTRVGSGAIRHKSVSEILGETPRISHTPSDKAIPEAPKEDTNALQTPKSAISTTSPDLMAFKMRLNELKEKDRNKVSTVVFAKHQSSTSSRLSAPTVHPALHPDQNAAKPRDYFLTYFAAQASTPPRAPPLSALLRSAHKTLATSDHYTEFQEKQDYRILSKVMEMQNSGRWSLRQPERSAEPPRSVTHWDLLLGEMKWLRTDYREERKLKLASAKVLASACQSWILADADDRLAMQVRVRVPTPRSLPKSSSEPATPELVHDGASEHTDDDLHGTSLNGDPPAMIFSLPPDVFIFGLNRSPISEKLLLELPCYNPSQEAQEAALRASSAFEPDRAWKTPLVPMSKYAQGKIVANSNGPPRKMPRLERSADPLEQCQDSQDQHIAPLPPATEEVALFNPESRHIRDRIYAGHAFRPPTEFQMPTKEFFESRQPSQWTLAEEDELRKLVREYSYNWSLISNCLSPRSVFSSGAERRTPWECFERWIQLEGLPAEMAKVPYFRTYNIRLQQAQRSYEAQQQALLQQHGGNPAQAPFRRRSTQPYTVELRKNMKHVHLFDAMRKQAKKREAALHKQQHVASLAAMRKAAEPHKAKQQVPAPRAFSRLKYEQQQKKIEAEKAFRLQMMQQQNQARRLQQQQLQQHQQQQQHQQHQQAQQQQQQQQLSQVPQVPQKGTPLLNNIPPGQPGRNMLPNIPNGVDGAQGSAIPQLRGANLDAMRNVQPMQRMSNGVMSGSPANGQANSPAMMQPQVQAQMGQRMQPQLPSELRIVQEAQRVQAEQQAFLQAQRHQRGPSQPGQAASPNMQNATPIPPNNAALLASLQGRSSPSMNVNQPIAGTNSSPRGINSQPQALSGGMTPAVNQIQNQVKMRNPGASAAEIKRLTTDQLYRMSQQTSLQQNAMAAAAGNSPNNSMISNMQTPNNPHQQVNMIGNNVNGAPHNGMFNQAQYAQYMRNQQAIQQQQRSGSAGNMNGAASTPGPVSGNDAPTGGNTSRPSTVTLIQRTGSAQGLGPAGPGRGPSQSPRQGPVGVAGGQ